MSDTIRVDPQVYADLLRHKHALEDAQGRTVSLSDVVADLLGVAGDDEDRQADEQRHH